MVRVEVKAGDLGLKNQLCDGKWCMMGSAAGRGSRKWEGGTTTVQWKRRNRESSFQHVAAVVQLQLQQSEQCSSGSLVWGLAGCSGGERF